MDKTGLKDWVISFLKNKDIVSRDIISIKENVDGFDAVVETSKTTKFVLAVLELSADVFPIIENNAVILTVSNSRHNLDFLIDNWQKFAANQKLCIFFVNPESSKDKKWILYPHTHNSFVENNLRTGLETLFSSVDEVR